MSVFHYNFKPSKNTSQKSVYFHNSIKNFHSGSLLVKSNLRACISKIVGQCIWDNTYTLKQGSTIFYTSLYKSGIMIINDLIDTEGNLMDWISAKLKF